MRVFKVPFDLKHEEKIFGGYLSLRQVIYLLIGAGSFGIFLTPINIAIKIIFTSLVVGFFLLCAFLKIGEQNFDKFFYFALKYVVRKKKFVYERCCK